MATKRTVQFDMQFDVEGLNTIGELENELSAINEQLKYVDINSESFKELSKQAQLADGKLRTVNQSLEGVTSIEKAEGIRKIGDGLVGAFQVAAGASLVFGEKTSEQLNKVIGQVAGLYAAMDGIKKITEAVSAQNLKFVKSAVTGFKKSAIAAKLFGTTTRAAITATGIGILIIGIGLLIANFDKLKAAAKKNFEQIKESLKFLSPPLYAIIRLVEVIKEKFGDLQNFIAGVGAAIKSALTFDGKGFKGVKEAFQETVELEKEADEIRGRYNEKITETEESHERSLELMKEQGVEQEEINKVIRERLELEKEEIEALDKIGKATDDQKTRLSEINHELELQQARENKLYEQRLKEAAEARKRSAEVAQALLDKAQADADAAEAEALANKNKLRQAELDRIALEAAERNLLIQREINDIQGQIYNTEVRKRPVVEYEELSIERRAGIYKELLKNNTDLLTLEEEYADVIADTNISEEEREKRLANIVTTLNTYMATYQTNLEGIVSTLSDESAELVEINELSLKLLDIEEKRLDNEAVRIKDLMKQETKGTIEYVKLQTELEGIDLQRNKVIGERLKLIKQDNKLIQESVEQSTELADVELTRQQQFDEWFANNEGKIMAATDYTTEMLLNLSDIFSGIAERRQNELDAWMESQREAYDEIEDLENDLADERDELNELLRDAEGDRYDDILAQLNAVDLKEQANEANKKLLFAEEKKRFEAVENAKQSAAKAEKAAALVNAIIYGLLAVVKALPNIPLAIAVGILSAAGVAAIAAKPIPPKAQWSASFADGGFTEKGGKYQEAGTVHRGEWVAPQSLVNDPVGAAMISTLEGMRRGYADGGAVESIAPNSAAQAELIDYERLTTSFIAGLRANPLFVSVTEFNDVANRLQVVENRSSI